MISKWIENRYWEGPISRNEFMEFKDHVLELLDAMEKANRATLAASLESKQFKLAQCAFNKIMLEKMGMTNVKPSNSDEIDVGTA